MEVETMKEEAIEKIDLKEEVEEVIEETEVIEEAAEEETEEVAEMVEEIDEVAEEIEEAIEEVVEETARKDYQRIQQKLKKFSMNNLHNSRRSKESMLNMTRKNQIKWMINSKHLCQSPPKHQPTQRLLMLPLKLLLQN
jgi:hypothetical protein